MQAAIQIERLCKQYKTGDGKLFQAVNDLSLEVREGEILAFLGPNGAGKTTTIKMMLGLVRPDSGRIVVNGIDPETHRPDVLRQVGAVLEGNRNIYWDLTVVENLHYWGTLKEVPYRTLKQRTEELVEFFDLGDKRKTIGKKLSRGMQQKLAIACSLIHDPKIILLDEPTLGLDVQAARLVRDRVQALCKEQGRTIVLTTHQLDVAQDLCERVAIMSKGELRTLDDMKRLIHLFSQQEYEFQIAGAVPEAALKRFGTLVEVKAGGFRILLRENDALYEVMDTLREFGCSPIAVNKKDANLEEVFVQITEGKGLPLRREVSASA